MTEDQELGSTAGYAAEAEALAVQYESVSFAEVHAEMLHLLPEGPAAVLDVGAGSGRDAAALAGMGHAVVAAEPVAELRGLGRRIHAAVPIEWVAEALPGLAGLRGRRFDLVLLIAVWMHLDEAERAAGMASLAGLLAPGGLLVLTLRHGPVPPGRRMFEVTAEETLALGAAHGLHEVHRGSRGDLHGRGGVRWSELVLRAAR